MFLFGCAALDAEDYETQIAWFDVSVVETVGNGVRWSGAVDAMAFESCEAFLLDRDDDFIAAQ